MKHSKKKKKRSSPSNQVGVKSAQFDEESKEGRVLKNLTEAFSSVSLEEAVLAYREADGDPNKAAEILGGLGQNAESQTISCSSSSSGSGSSSANWGRHGDQGRGVKETKHKKIIASTGTVSTVIGKEYVMTTPRKDSFKDLGSKEYINEPGNKGDAEQFLCSMLGQDCELSLAVVRDVLCQCGYNVQKGLNVLLELCASSYECSKNGQKWERTSEIKEDTHFVLDSENLTDRASDSTSHTSESEIQDNEWSMGYPCRNYSEVLTGSGVNSMAGLRNSKSELPENVLKALFNVPNSSEHEPNTMNWRDIVKKMESLGQRFNGPPNAAEPVLTYAKGDEYHLFRKAAKQNWDTMKSCYQKAAAAFSNGERDYAAYLSEQGRTYNKIAQEADEKASQEIFRARNKSIENMITIDLHGQHVKQALSLLKAHLLFGAYVRSIQVFRVITGCGSHGVGKSKLKQAVIDLIKKEGIKWKEENRGTILIRLEGQREFAFQESENDSE